MKASEAPEKIYVDSKAIGDNISTTVHITPQDYPTCTEYTRTNAFIKKAENFLEMLGYGFTIIDNITHTDYDKEQLIADFRNYMKGE